jgi:hypothetical protein
MWQLQRQCWCLLKVAAVLLLLLLLPREVLLPWVALWQGRQQVLVNHPAVSAAAASVDLSCALGPAS